MATRPTLTAEEANAARTARISAAVSQLTDLFTSGALPERIAQTEIARLEADKDVPSVKWSLQNRILMLLANTSDGRGFQQWKQVGRSVVKDAHCFHILGPTMVKAKDEVSGEERSILVGFHTIPMFRFEDTDGEPLLRPDYTPPVLPVLHDVAEAWKVPVTWLPFEGRYRGYHAHGGGGDRIVLCTHDARTFFHELAHAAHLRVMEAAGRQMQGGQDPRQEVVAETCAAVLCRLYGFDGYLWHSHDYISHYGGKNPAQAVARVLGDVEKSLALILETHEAEEVVVVEGAASVAVAV